MAFQLGSFIVQLLGDTSHLDGALRSVQASAQSVGKAVSGASGGGMKIPGAEATQKALDGAATAAKTLGGAMRGLLEIDLSTVMQLGTIAGVVGMIGRATKKFMELSDETKNTELRFRFLKMETEENTKRFFAFGKQMQESFGIAQSEARKLSMDALTKGINPARYQEMTAAAVAFAAATGKSNSQAMTAITQLEAGNTRVLRTMHTSFRIAMEQGASRFTLEQMVNDMIRGGAEAQKERMKTFSGQVQRLKNQFEQLSLAVASAIGPAVAPIVSKLADAIEGLTRRVTAYVEANKETIGQTIRTAAALVAGAAAFLLFRNQIGGVIGLIGNLAPSVSGLWQTFQMGYNVAPFGFLRRAIVGCMGAVRGLVLLTLQAGVQAALFLFSPTRIAAAVTQGVLIGYQLVVGGVGVACGVAAVGARLLALAIRGVLFATGVGILVGLVGMMLGFADTFGNAATGVEGFGDMFQSVIAEVRAIAAPVIEWLRVEGMIVFKALIAAARQMVDNLKIFWQDLQAAWAEVTVFFRANFGEAVTWVEQTFGIKIDSIKSMWEEFTAELAVMGLRFRQVFLMIVIGLASIPAAIQWLGECFRVFADYVANNWQQVLIGSLATVVEGVTALGTGLGEIGDKIGDALSGKSVDFDFSATEKAFAKLKGQATETLKGIKMPELDVSAVAPGLKAELDKVTGEIKDKKQAARESQAKDRLNAQNRGTGKTDDGKGGDPKANVLIGSKDKAQFQETVGFWKKVQEAGAGQRAEFFMQAQLDQQREMVKLLSAINTAMAAPKAAPPGGVVPR